MSDKRNKEFNQLPIDSFFNFEADHINIAHNQVKIIHNSGNIPASGNHLEVAIREFFKSKLPSKYYISNGHIIDNNLKTSSQLDLIIADNFKTPVLYKTLDNTEYLTFESIYSYAEIKSSWENKHLSDFIITRERIDKFLNRSKVSPNFIDTGGKGLELNIKTTNNAYKNPLFSFMFFASSKGFSIKKTVQKFNETNWKFLPNIICLFDKGIIVNINKAKLQNKVFKINLYPEFINNKDNNEWVFLSYDRRRSSLGTLYYIVLEHLNACVLGYPNILDYMQKIFDIDMDNINFFSDYSL